MKDLCGGWGGQFLYNTGTDKNGSAHNQIRITIQAADEKKKEVEEGMRRKSFTFMNVLREIVREPKLFEQTNFLAQLDLCSSLSGGAIYSLFG